MPELGPYGSMRGEVRENLPYRDYGTKNPPSKVNHLRVPTETAVWSRPTGPRFALLTNARAPT
jgi:hypothetical protein